MGKRIQMTSCPDLGYLLHLLSQERQFTQLQPPLETRPTGSKCSTDFDERLMTSAGLTKN